MSPENFKALLILTSMLCEDGHKGMVEDDGGRKAEEAVF